MTDYARKMSLDLRMISEDKYSNHIDNKASHCAKMLNDYYQKYNEQKGTQFVFSGPSQCPGCAIIVQDGRSGCNFNKKVQYLVPALNLCGVNPRRSDNEI